MNEGMKLGEIWSEFASALIGLFGVIVGAVITIASEFIKEYTKRKRSASYSAIRLISILQAYMSACYNVVQDDGTSCGQPAGRTESGEMYHVVQVKTPDTLSFPDDIEWRSLDEQIMHRILAFPSSAQDTDKDIAAAAEISFLPDLEELFIARQLGYSQLGLEAITIVESLRQRYNIEAPIKSKLSPGFDYKRFFENKIQELDTNQNS